MVESNKKGGASAYHQHGAVGANPHSMTNKAVHVDVLKPPESKCKHEKSRSRSPRLGPKPKPTGFVNLEKAGAKVKMDEAMTKH